MKISVCEPRGDVLVVYGRLSSGGLGDVFPAP